MNMVRVFDRLGVAVRYDDRQTCCGQPAFNTGYHREARVLAMRFLDIFDDAEYVVAPSGSCVTMAKVFYGDLLQLPASHMARAESLRARIFEFTEFLVDVLGVTDVGARFAGRVGLHDSCHALRELGVRSQPRALLRMVRGLDFVELDSAERCCGFGGTFSIKNEELSVAMGEDKVASIERAGIDVVTAVDSSCLMHLGGLLERRGLQVRAMHIADILASEAS